MTAEVQDRSFCIKIFHLTTKIKILRVKTFPLISQFSKLQNPAILEQACRKPLPFCACTDRKQWLCTSSRLNAASQWKSQLCPFLPPSPALKRMGFRWAQMLVPALKVDFRSFTNKHKHAFSNAKAHETQCQSTHANRTVNAGKTNY